MTQEPNLNDLSSLSSLKVASLYEEQYKVMNSEKWLTLSAIARRERYSIQDCLRDELVSRGDLYLVARAEGLPHAQALQFAAAKRR